MVGRIDAGWPATVLETARTILDIIRVIEQIMPDRSGPEKLAGAVLMLQAQEPPVLESAKIKAAREAMLSAQVAYLNALSESDV